MEGKTLIHQYHFVILGLVRCEFIQSEMHIIHSVNQHSFVVFASLAMEALVDKGLVKHIGLANFPVALLHDLLSYSRIPPAVNQVEMHPYNQQSNLLAYCKSRGVAVQAYSPLGTPGYKENGEPDVLSDPVLKEIASAHEMSVAQLCLQWSLQRGCHVVAKSSNKKHLKENLLVNYKNEFVSSDGELLSLDEIERIATLEKGYRFSGLKTGGKTWLFFIK